MVTRKHIILGFLIFLLLTSIVLIICWRNHIHSYIKLYHFSERIESENIDDLSLTIYYRETDVLTNYPVSVDGLMKWGQKSKIVIRGNDLKEHFDLFKQISNKDFIPVKKKSYINAYLYYVLESKKTGKLLDVAMGSGGNSIFVNGIEVERNRIFYDVMMPFLSEDALKVLGNSIIYG